MVLPTMGAKRLQNKPVVISPTKNRSRKRRYQTRLANPEESDNDFEKNPEQAHLSDCDWVPEEDDTTASFSASETDDLPSDRRPRRSKRRKVEVSEVTFDASPSNAVRNIRTQLQRSYIW